MSDRVKILRWKNIINPEDDYSYIMWKDVINLKGVTLSNAPKWCRKDSVIEFHKNNCKKSIWNYFWYRIYLNNSGIRKQDHNIVIINDAHPCLNNLEFVDYLKKKYQATVILCCINQIKNKRKPKVFGIDLKDLENKFDYIYSSDNEDAKRYNLKSFTEIYSKIKIENNKIFTNDLFYMGFDKGRTTLLKEISILAERNNIKTDFNLVRNGYNTGAIKEIKYSKWKPYPEILREVMKSNCILEIVEPGQSSATLRYVEALCYNKKLLTNNQSIRNFEFYDERYMKVFENLEDIDVEFIKDRELVNYHYKGEYSPKHFIKDVLFTIKNEKSNK
ncbi:MAG TPA: hypothetical protein VJZ04_09295 [Lachnospiraceae bacterium]|nr:hypothetical protein [Lachnospiraceae bacterium]